MSSAAMPWPTRTRSSRSPPTRSPARPRAPAPPDRPGAVRRDAGTGVEPRRGPAALDRARLGLPGLRAAVGRRAAEWTASGRCVDDLAGRDVPLGPGDAEGPLAAGAGLCGDHQRVVGGKIPGDRKRGRAVPRAPALLWANPAGFAGAGRREPRLLAHLPRRQVRDDGVH